jgi:hypothetical protein
VTAHTVQWVSASPLWSNTLNGGFDTATLGQKMRAPALLRFEQDRFMDELAQTLAHNPDGLEANVASAATAVTYRLPAPGESHPPPPTQLKLFQAAHGHFYLIAASLTCRLPGLPDHEVNPSAREKVAFVLRRIDDADTEWAWCSDSGSPPAKGWAQLDPSGAGAVATGEDLLPLFPACYQAGDKQRRIYVGLVPTSSSDTFKAAGTLSPLAAPGSGAGAPASDPRPTALATKVTDPLRALAAAPTTAPADVTDPTRRQAIEDAEVAQLVEASRFLLVDFAEFLVTNMPAFWSALNSRQRPGDAGAGALYDALTSHRADSSSATTWRDALISAWNTAAILYGDAAGTLPPALNLAGSPLSGDQLDSLIDGALPEQAPNAAGSQVTSIQGDSVDPPQVPKLDPQGHSRYWIRCVYQRPQCSSFQPDVVGDPSERFQIAGFFDFDAPSRSIQISLPIDTGIADLRKLRKNVSFLLSNQLRAQMNRVTNLNDALKGQFADGGSFDVGLICSFSIPIITICALLVLMIFIQLLNIVFWWMPFLRICFPIALKSGSSS